MGPRGILIVWVIARVCSQPRPVRMAPAAAEARSARHKRGRCGTIHAASLSGCVMALVETPDAEFTLRPAAKSTAAVAAAPCEVSLDASAATSSAAGIATRRLDWKLMRM